MGETPSLPGPVIDKIMRRHNIVGVIAHGTSDSGSWVKEAARSRCLPFAPLPKVLTLSKPKMAERLKREKDSAHVSAWLDGLRGMKPDVGVVLYGGWVPPALAALPNHGFLNYHGAPLPKGRGPIPLLFDYLDNRSRAQGVIHKVVEQFDAGDVFARTKRIDVAGLKPAEANRKLYPHGVDAVIKVLDGLAAGTARPLKQDKTKATYATTRRFQQKYGRIDWGSDTSEMILKKVIAFKDHYSGTLRLKARFKGSPVRVKSAAMDAGMPAGPPGTIAEIKGNKVAVNTKDGVVLLGFENCPRLLSRMKPGARFT